MPHMGGFWSALEDAGFLPRRSKHAGGRHRPPKAVHRGRVSASKHPSPYASPASTSQLLRGQRARSAKLARA